MTLEQAIGCFRLVQNFEEYKEGLGQVLTRCHTQEELDKAKEVIEEEKTRLLETNDEFKTIMDRRKQEAKMRGDESRAVHKAKMSQSKAEASRARTDAMSRVRSAMPDPDIEEWVAKTRFKTVDPDELEKRSKEELWCPICREKNTSRNIVNDYPTCMKHMHRLVPKSELKDYPRKYRRAWNKGKKKKKRN